jgi:hypothetical protein
VKKPTLILSQVLRIAKNDVEKLTYGWFVVRNRSTQEINEGVTIEGRHRKEQQFFSTTIPWTELKKDRVGIRALKHFLGILLYDHIRSEFPAVVADIEQLYSKILEELDLLGPSRHTASEQRRFLTRVMTTYQQEVSKALRGNYDADLEALSPVKLRMHLRQLADDFSRNMSLYGHKEVFRTPNDSVDFDFCDSGDSGCIYAWIRSYYLESRGSELPGTVSPAVIENLFRQQSSPWENIATTYVEEVFVAVTRYNATILTMIAPDRDVRDKLQNLVAQREKETSSSAHNQLHQILNDERGGILQTANHYYADTLSSIRKERAAARMIEIDLSTDLNSDENVHKIIKRTHMSNEEQTILDIHDILQAYYKVAIKRFVDNVIIQVSERYIQGDSGPMKLFSPDVISDFDDNRLAYIAGESLATSVNRRDLLEKAVRFKKALNRARQAAL